MLKFLKTIFCFGLIFLVLEKVFYPFLLLSPHLEVDNRLEKIINGEINKDVIVLGSSRGASNIIASQIEASTGMSAFNLSYPGSDIEFHEFLLRSLVNFNRKPKIVLLAIDDPAELLPDKSIKFRLDRLYPLSRYKYINDEMIHRGEKSFFSHFLVLSRMNKSNFNFKRKNFTSVDSIMACGSMPISIQKRDSRFNYDSSMRYNQKIESQKKIDAFLKFQKICIDNNVKLYLIFSPNFRIHNRLFENRLRQLARPEVSFYVYDTLRSTYRDKSFFYDESHLRKNGAVLFTHDIINELKADNDILAGP